MLGAILNGTEIQNSSTDYVTSYQIPTAANNYTWYRKYKSGWVEQGGIVGTASTGTDTTILLPVTMADTNYTWSLGFSYHDTSNPTWEAISIWNQTTTSFQCRKSTIQRVWEVKGIMAA